MSLDDGRPRMPAPKHDMSLHPVAKPERCYDIDPVISIPIPVPDTPEVLHRIFDSSQVFKQHPRKFDSVIEEKDKASGTSSESSLVPQKGICTSRLSFSGKSPPKLTRRSTTSDMFVALAVHKASREAPPRRLARRNSEGVIDLPSTLSKKSIAVPSEREVSSQPDLSAGPTSKKEKMPVGKPRPKLTRSSTEPDLQSLLEASSETLSETSVSGGLTKTVDKTSPIKSPIKGRPRLLRRATDTELLKSKDSGDSQPHITDESGSLGWLFKAFLATSTSGWTVTEDPSEGTPIDPTPSRRVRSTSEATPELVPVSVTPEPRRLFGFGPSYQPPPETVMVSAEQAKKGDGALVQKIKKEGISSVVKSPTKAELNTLAYMNF